MLGGRVVEEYHLTLNCRVSESPMMMRVDVEGREGAEYAEAARIEVSVDGFEEGVEVWSSIFRWFAMCRWESWSVPVSAKMRGM